MKWWRKLVHRFFTAVAEVLAAEMWERTKNYADTLLRHRLGTPTKWERAQMLEADARSSAAGARARKHHEDAIAAAKKRIEEGKVCKHSRTMPGHPWPSKERYCLQCFRTIEEKEIGHPGFHTGQAGHVDPAFER